MGQSPTKTSRKLYLFPPLAGTGVARLLSVLLAGFGVIAVLLATVVSSLLFPARTQAAAGINQQLNFQGRLFNQQGAVVPDGYYNIQFKIYQDGDGQSVGDTTGSPAGTLKWNESYVNNNASQGVRVVNGYLSVQLGTNTPFGSSVDWNQDTLWLSMNIAGTANTCTSFASCTPDGEMTPMKRLSANAYALQAQNANQLGGIAASGFIQNTVTPQSANIAVQSASAGAVGAVISGAASQTADILQVKANGNATPLLSVAANGTTTSTGGLTVTGNGTVAFQRGSDFTTVGSSNDVAFGSGSVIRLNGASAQTVTGIAGGYDGRVLTLINAGSSSATLNNNDGASLAANRIVTGTGANLPIPAGASINLIYDSGASVWRVTGTSAATGGSGVNVVGTFNGATSYANGAQISGTTITFGAANASNPGLVSTITQTLAGDKTLTGNTTLSGNLTATGTANFQSSTNSASAFVVQNAAGNNFDTVFGIDTTAITSNLASNGSFEVDTSGWSAKTAGSATSTLGRVSNQAAPFGSNALSITTGGTIVASDYVGVKIPVSLSSATTYSISLYVKASGSNFGTVSVGRSDNGSTDTTCTTSAAASTTGWQRLGCTFTTGTVSGSPYVFIGQNDTTARTYYVDGFTVEQTTNGAFYKEARINTAGSAFNNVLIQPAANTNQALLVANAAGTSGLQVDTLNSAIALGFATTINGNTLVNSTNATAFRVRNAATAAPLVLADTTIANILTNGSIENGSTGFAANQAGVSVAADGTTNNAYIGGSTLKVTGTTSAVANSGTKYALTTATLTSTTQYTLSFFAKLATGQPAFTTLVAGRADNGSTETGCTLSGTGMNFNWQRYSCTFMTGTTSGTPYIYIGQSDAGTAHIYYLDGVQLEAAASATTYREGKLQFNGDIISPTVFKNQSDSTAAFQIQNANGTTNLFTADTANNRIAIGANTANYTLDVTGDINTTTGLRTGGTTRLDSNGALSNITGYGQTSGNFSQTGTGTFGTGTGAVSLNGATSVTGTLDVSGAASFSGGVTATNAGNVAFQRGSDFSTTGTVNDANFGSGALVRLTGTLARTITSIAGGSDGRLLTIINASTANASLSDTSAALGIAANRIFTGTAGSISIPAGGSLSLVYDTGVSRWRVIGSTSIVGGYIQNTTSQQTSASFNIDGTGTIAGLLTANGGITVAGAISQTSGNFSQTGSGTFGTGTGAVSLNGATSITGSNSFSVGSGATSLGGTLGVSGATTLSGGLTVSNGGNVAFQRGSDFTTTGTVNDASFGNGAVIRLNGASAQTLTGITGGVDGRLLTLINASSNPLTINNNDSGSLAANRIITGTGTGLTVPAGASITLVYDSGASLWRLTGSSAATGGAGVNAIGTFVNGTAYANGAQISGTTITFGEANGTTPGMISTGSQTIAGAKSFSGLVTASSGLTVSAGNFTQNGTGTFTTGTGAVSLNGDTTVASGKNFSVNAGSTTLTGSVTASNGIASINANSNYATNINTGTSTGAVSIGGGSNTVSFGSNTSVTGANTFSVGTGATNLGGSLGVTGTATFSSTLGVSGLATFSGGVTATNAGSVAFQRGADFSTIGTVNDAALGNSALVRLTGASAQTITSITGGFDGRLLTIINAGSNAATLSDVSAGLGTAANRIATGTGAAISIPSGASIAMVYDSGSSLWRVTSAAAATGGVGVNAVGAFSGSTSYTNGAQITGTTITLGAADASNPGLVSNNTQTFSGTKTFSTGLNIASGQNIQFNGVNTLSAGALAFSAASAATIQSAASQALNLTGNGASSFSTTAGVLTLNGFSGVNLQNNGTTIASVSSTAFNVASGMNFAQSGSGTFGTGTGAVSLNGATSVTGSNTFSVGTGATSLGGTLAVSGAAGIGAGIAAYAQLNVVSTNVNNNALFVTGATNQNAPVLSVGGSSGQTGRYLQIKTSGNADLFSVENDGSISTGGTTRLNTSGALSNITGYAQTGGNFSQSGTGTFGTGSGAVSLNGDTTVGLNKNFAQSGTGTFSTGSGAVSLNGDTTIASGKVLSFGGASSISNTSGALALTSAAAATWSTTSGDLTLQSGSGTLRLGSTATVTSNGILSILSGGSGYLSLDTSGQQAVNIGATNANAVAIGNNTNNSAIDINSGTGTINVGVGAQARVVNVATGAAAQSLNLGSTNGASTTNINSGSGGINFNGAAVFNGNLTVANTGNVAFQRGSDFSTVGSTNNANFGSGALIRLTGATAQTITGIQGGSDGRILTIVNAGSTTATLTNNDGASTGGNRIYTGINGSLPLPANSAITLVYDSNGGFWRVTGTAAATGGAGTNTVGAISATSNANGATITGTTLNLTAADGTNGGVVSNTTQSFAGDKTFNGNLSTGSNLSVTGTSSLTGNITASGTYNGNTFTGSALTFGAASAATIQSATSQALNLTGNASSSFSTTGTLSLNGSTGVALQYGAVTVASTTSANDFTIAANKNLVLASGTGTVTQTYAAASGTAATINANATTGNTVTSGLNVNAAGAGTVTNGVLISQGAGTVTNGLAFSGTIGTDINRGSGTLSVAGAAGISLNTGTGGAIVKNGTNNSAAFQVQNANGTPLLGVSTVAPTANLITNPGFEVNATGYGAKSGGATTRVTTPSSALYYGVAAGQLVTGTSANGGVAYSQSLTLGTTYNLSFYARASSGTATGISFGYTNTGGDQNCQTGLSVPSTGFTRFSCSFTVTTTAGTAFYIKQSGTTSQTIYIDAFQLLGGGATSATPYSLGSMQLRGVIDSPVSLQNANDSTTAFQIQNSAGTSNLFVADTLNSRVGIGTSAPTTALDVNGTITTSGVSSGIKLLAQDQSGNLASLYTANGDLTFYTGLNVRAMLKANGNFGVGLNTSPAYPLDVTGDINTSTQYRIGGNVALTNTSLAFAAASAATIQSAASQALNLTGNASSSFSTTGTLSLNGSTGVALQYGAVTNASTSATGFDIAAGKNLTLASGTGTFSQTYTGTSGNAASIAVAPASGTVGSALNIGNSGAGTVTSGVAVGNSAGTMTNGVAINQTGGTLTNGLNLTGTIGNGVVIASTSTNGINFTGTVTTEINDSNSLTVNSTTGTIFQTNATTRAAFDTSNNLIVGNGGTTGTAAAPNAFTIKGTGSGTTGVAGGALNIQGGAATVGNANGGYLNLSGGVGVGTGATGLVVVNTPTFSTAGNQTCASNCNITQANVDGNGVVVVTSTGTGVTASLPNPTISDSTAYGRIVYVTAANASNDFTLSVNGGGTGNQIAMRAKTTATMVWGAGGWTAAGASSSTTLQAAYDNTLTSAGGAELLVSNGSTANGLTIRDSSLSPINGTLLEVQTASAATLLSVNSGLTEYAVNAGAETTFSGSDWTASGTATVSRNTTAANAASGQASVQVDSATAASGVKNTLSQALTPGITYNVSFAAKLPTSASTPFSDMAVYWSNNGTAQSVTCATGQTIASTLWTKVNCAFTTPSSGTFTGNAILIQQAAAPGSSRTFYIDNLSVTAAADYNYATDSSVNDSVNYTTNWPALGGSSTAYSTTTGNDNSNSMAMSVTAANQGVKNKLAVSPIPSTRYRVTAYALVTSGTSFSNFTVSYSPNDTGVGGTDTTLCQDYNTQTIPTGTVWQRVTCYITTPSNATIATPRVYFYQSAAGTRTFNVDTFSMTLASAVPNVQVGGGSNGGPTTLFTLDKGASAPIGANNDALLGSMYYDTSLGKLQCYEADGWGACGSSPDSIVTISPEYTNAVLNGTGVGTMTSDLCSGTSGLSINTSICAATETYNFYKWTSPQPTAQTYSIYVTYQLPSNFKSFNSGATSLMARTDSTNSSVTYQIYKNSASGLVACGTAQSVSSGSQTSWQTKIAVGSADPSTCAFAANNSIVFKITTTASSNANAYVGNLNFAFSNK